MKEKSVYIYNKFFKKYLCKLLICFIISCILSVISFIEPILNQYLIDDVLENKNFYKIVNIIMAFLILYLLTNFFSFIIQKISIDISIKSISDIKQTIIHKLQLKRSSIATEKQDDILVSITQDSSIIVSFYNEIILGTVISMLYIVLLIIYLMRYSVLLTITVFFISIIQLIIVKIYAPKIRQNVEEFKINTGSEFGFIKSTIINMKLIKSYNFHKDNVGIYSNILTQFRNLTWKNFRITFSQSILINTVSVLSNLIVIICGTFMVIKGNMTIGVFIVFISLSNNLKGSLESIVSISQSLQQFKVALTRVYSLIINNEESETAINTIQVINEIDFSFVNYNISETRLFNQLNLKLSKGNPIIIIGNNGTGKSTLIDIIIKEVRVSGGIVSVNNLGINDIKEIDLNNRIAVSFQDNFFIRDTIMTNLKMGNKNITNTELDHILTITNCKYFIDNLEMGLNTYLNEINNKLSGGELQRLNIARALIKKADVYLFDEVFSNIDDNSKLPLFNNIIQYLQDKIIVFITHDEKIIKNNQDKLWLLDNHMINKVVNN